MADKSNTISKKTIIAIAIVIVLLFIAGLSVGIFLADKGSTEAVDRNQSTGESQTTEENKNETTEETNNEETTNEENKNEENARSVARCHDDSVHGGLRLEERCGKYGDKSACRKRPRRFRSKGYH